MKENRFIFGSSGQPDLRSVRLKIEQDFSELRQSSPRVLGLALNEAEALAWQTGLAQLFFPVLAEEKAKALSVWQSRQRMVSDTTSILTLAE